MQMIITITILLALFHLMENSIYLFDTQERPSIENYDCVFVHSLPYCRRSQHPVNLTRIHAHYSCTDGNGGSAHSFSRLQAMNVSISTVLHQWKSGVEQVEAYVRYLSDNTQTDGYLCQCQHESFFGKHCEYQLPVGATFEETLAWHMEMRHENQWEVQLYGNITCYESITCNSGLLCLDWREICDGIQNCMYGYDEENCDILELNICDDDEYRCMNGMCIPDEYFLDGEVDCLDWTDELRTKKSQDCATESASVRCDDHICLTYQWSCGDGQCIHDRLAFQTEKYDSACINRRDQFFMCETHYKTSVWTIPNGRCYGGKQYKADLISASNGEKKCEYLLKCALSKGTDENCCCKGDSSRCIDMLVQTCSETLIQYPKNTIIAPFLSLFFAPNRASDDNLPDFVLINGTLKCGNFLVDVTEWFPFNTYPKIRHITKHIFCEKIKHQNRSVSQHDFLHQCFHSNESTNICNEWNPCISTTRIKDGWLNCLNENDEAYHPTSVLDKSCSRLRRHRFRCSMTQPTCLNIIAFGDYENDCENAYDEFWRGSNRRLAEMQCNEKTTDDCFLLRQYIEQSWSTILNNDTVLTTRISFRSYCDTFFNLESAEDEKNTECRRWWKCAVNQWQCNSGQCIEHDWLNDLDWDCRDASDQQELLESVTQTLDEQALIYQPSDESTWALETCHPASSFYCLSPHSAQQQFICLNLSQLGDRKIDCLGAIDERNTIKHCSDSSLLLGYNFLCPSNNQCIPFREHCHGLHRCSNRTDDEHWCSRSYKPSNCAGSKDFICFDGECIRNGRCNSLVDCFFGEDEYMCDYTSFRLGFGVPYRHIKESYTKTRRWLVSLPPLPTHLNITLMSPDATVRPPLENITLTRQPSILTPYWCNRGIGILSYQNSIVCFCPPQYYGQFCQYHADRLLVLLHLNLSQSIYTSQTDPTIVIKLLVLFLFNEQVLMTHEFHVRPAFEVSQFTKKIVSFPYSRSSLFRQHRQDRYSNRTDIIRSQPYSIRIEAYEIDATSRFASIAVWQYPILFDYLPVYRFAKILHLPKIERWNENPCSNHPCPSNAQCHALMNNKSQYICLCKPNFTGGKCTIRDEECASGYCARESLCKSNYRSLSHGNASPYCLCPYNRYGDRCNIIGDYCELNPCLHGGSCFPTSRLDRVICRCTKEYRGSRCQLKKSHVRLSITDNTQYHGATVQYFQIDFFTFNLILLHQQVFKKLPSSMEYFHDATIGPEIVLTKIYQTYDRSSPDLYLLSLSLNATSIEGMTEISDYTRCLHVHKILHVSSPIQYHRICIANHELLCFHDEIYLCICGANHTHVECFLYDDQLDRCSKCSSGGCCLQGDRKQSNDFLCLCPSCYSGRRCQFNSKSFAFTLDQLLYTDLTSSRKGQTMILLAIFSVLSFLLAIPNNLFSFMTFRRRICLRNEVSHYLLYLSVINQINLTFFLLRLIHLIINMITLDAPSPADEILCRSLSYILTCSGRLVYWLSSLIAVERVYTAVVLNGQRLKKPCAARCLLPLFILGILIIHCYELIFYKPFFDLEDGRGSICVFEYPAHSRSLWSTIHLVTTITNSFVPFLINLCSAITISIIVVRNRMKTLRKETSNETRLTNFRRRFRLALNVLRDNKELVIGPAVTLIPQSFSLPLIVAGFVSNCENLENSWFRHLLIVSYWATLTPQWTSFFLYISSSSFYSNEWQKTKIARWIYTRLYWHSSVPTTEFIVLSKT